MSGVTRNLMLSVAAAGALGLVGCGGSGGGEGTGTLNIGLTDSPVDSAESVVVQFTGVELKPAGGPPQVYDLDSDSCDEFDTEGNCSIDLLQLQGMAAKPVFAEELPAGDYEWVRLLVNAEQNTIDSYIVLEEGGAQCSLWIPSGSRTGLKVVSGITVTTNGVSNYMLDFDVRKSVTRPPGIAGDLAACVDNYVLKPAIRIVDETEVGHIAGTIDPGLLTDGTGALLPGCRDESPADGFVDHLAVYVFEDFDEANPVTVDDYDGNGDPIASAKVETDVDPLAYEVGYLLAGDYRLGLTCTPDVDPRTEDNFDCDASDPEANCVDSDPAFNFVDERSVTVTIGDVPVNGDFPAP